MAGMLDLSDQVFKITVVNMLKMLMGKVDSMQEDTCDVGREMEILRRNQ